MKWKNFFFSFFRGKEKDIWFFAKNAVKRWAGSSTKLKRSLNLLNSESERPSEGLEFDY